MLQEEPDRVTNKVDVFSFAVVMWEIWTLGAVPYPGLTMPAIFAGVVSGSLRPSKLADAPPSWVSLMHRCWATSAAERPTFTQVPARVGLRARAACTSAALGPQLGLTEARAAACAWHHLLGSTCLACWQGSCLTRCLLCSMPQEPGVGPGCRGMPSRGSPCALQVAQELDAQLASLS